jgi:dolichyl-phosphate beta-glucosyltransferase
MVEPALSVIVPAYNEGSRLELSLSRIQAHLRDRRIPYEILVVDDGSQDATLEVAERFSREHALPEEVRILRNLVNRGKGYSVREGMLAARSDLALMTDADLSTPITELAKLEACLESGGLDIAMGSRDLEQSRVEIRQPWRREVLGKLFNRVVRLLTGLPFRDTQCGFKLFRLSSCRDVFRCQRTHGFVFDVELLVIARRWGLRAEEVPVVWRHAEGSKVRPVGHLLPVVIDLLRIRLNNARGLYGRDRFVGGPASSREEI